MTDERDRETTRQEWAAETGSSPAANRRGDLSGAFAPRTLAGVERPVRRTLLGVGKGALMVGAMGAGLYFLLREPRSPESAPLSRTSAPPAPAGGVEEPDSVRFRGGLPEVLHGGEPTASVDALRARASELVAGGDALGALTLYEQVVESGSVPRDRTERARLFLDAGSAALLAEYRERALAFFRESIAADPEADNGKALNNAAFVLVKSRGDLDEARRLIERALKVSPDSPEYLDTLASVQVAQGNVEQATATLRKAEKLSVGKPSHPRIAENLGDLLTTVPNVDEALLFWRRAAAENPTNDRLWRKIAAHSE